MFAKKTRRLVEIYKECKKTGIEVLVINHKTDNRYFEAEFVDLGFICMKKGAAEKVEYPWFEPHTKEGESVNLFTDSYSYCKKLKNKGVKIMVDSNIKMNYSEL